MKIYVAASYARVEEIQGYANILKDDGHEITSYWLTRIPEREKWPRSQCALTDVVNILEAECLLLFTEASPVTVQTGGKDTEFGMAVALGLRPVICGPRINPFHHLPHVEAYGDFEECRRLLKYAIPPDERDLPGTVGNFNPRETQTLMQYLGKDDLATIRSTWLRG